MAAACVAALPVTGARAELRAGAASVDITPPVGTPMFAYTARSGIANPDNLQPVLMNLYGDPGSAHFAKTFVPSKGIHLRVRTRALVFQTGGRTWAMVQADLGGLPYTLTQDVLDHVGDIGVTADTLLLSATHTHSSAGPIWPTESNLGYALLGGDVFDPRVYGEIRDGVIHAIRQAYSTLRPAKAGLATVQVTGASRNRNYVPYQRDPETPKDPVAAKAASVDPDLTVLRVDELHGAPIAVWSNFAVHPTSFGDDNLLFSGDNAGVGARLAEEKITSAAAKAGKPRPLHPVVDVWTNANEGDISPNGDPDVLAGQAVQSVPNAFAGANIAGERQSVGILKAWKAAGSRLSTDFSIDSRRTLMSFDGTAADGEPVGPLQSLGYGGVIGDDGVCSPLGDVGIPGQAPKLTAVTGILLAPSTVPVSVWSLGGYGILGYPAEITKTMGARIRAAALAASGGKVQKVLIAGLTNGYVSYTATPEEYDSCGYEGSFTLFGRQEGARWRDIGVGLMRDLAAGVPAPAGSSEPVRLRVGVSGPGPRVTPSAGRVVAQPAGTVSRFGRATFRWTGGDPAVDASDSHALVTLERAASHGRWVSIGTDDGLHDTTALAGGAWTETWQFGECDLQTSYRFHVTGDADRGSGVKPYELTSESFRLGPMDPLSVGAITVSRSRIASVLITYPSPGKSSLMALPRLLRRGRVVFAYFDRHGRYRTATAKPPKLTANWTARLGRGAHDVSVKLAKDGCGNASKPRAGR
jgi:neutral ceramidase